VLQWREASYTTPAGDIERVYTVCNADVANDTDHWLAMPFLAAETANRIYVQVRFIMRRCAAFSHSSSTRHCKVGYPQHVSLLVAVMEIIPLSANCAEID